MNGFFDFIVSNWYVVVSIVAFILSILVAVISLLKGHSVSKALKNAEETYDKIIKGGAEVKIPEKNRANYQKAYSSYVKDYILDEKTNELVEKETPRNVQAEIDSYKYVALNEVLARLLPDPTQTADDMDEYYIARGDLDAMLDVQALADDYRAKFKLSEDMPFDEVIKYVDRYAAEQREKLIKQVEDLKKAVEDTVSVEAEEEVKNGTTSSSVEEKE